MDGCGKHRPLVGVIMGSASDLEKTRQVFETLDLLETPYEVAVISAHRTPDLVGKYAAGASGRGVKVVIAAAGLAAALPGALSALVDIPVIGLPLGGGPVNGVDALLSVTDMPPGIPVAAVGIDSGRNAALLAARILGLSDSDLARRLLEMRQRAAEDVQRRASDLREKGLPAWDPQGSATNE